MCSGNKALQRSGGGLDLSSKAQNSRIAAVSSECVNQVVPNAQRPTSFKAEVGLQRCSGRKRRSTRAQEDSGCFSGIYCQVLIARGIQSASSQSSLPPPTSGEIAFNVVLPELLFLCLFCVCVLLSRISEAACSYYVRPACTIVPLQQIQKIQAGGGE